MQEVELNGQMGCDYGHNYLPLNNPQQNFQAVKKKKKKRNKEKQKKRWNSSKPIRDTSVDCLYWDIILDAYHRDWFDRSAVMYDVEQGTRQQHNPNWDRFRFRPSKSLSNQSLNSKLFL